MAVPSLLKALKAALAVPEGTAENLVVKEGPALQLTVRGTRPVHAPGGFPRFESQRAVADNELQDQK